MMSMPCSWPAVVVLSAALALGSDCPVSDDATPDYTALLNVRSSGSLHVVHRPENLLDARMDHETPQSMRSGKETVSGVVFVKMIKVAGELFSSVLAQYAMKRGWRVLQHKDCGEDRNPLGQATCACDRHYIGPGELPAAPSTEHRYAALYTHMHYDPEALQDYIVPGVVKLVILRHPLYVLRSSHAMAAVQASEEKFKHIKNNFCQNLAHDGDAWRAECAFLQTGQDSLLDYLDHDANEQLTRLLANSSGDVHQEAMAIVDRVTQRLETFIVGLQEEFDASMLLFERALGWSRDDSLYVKHDTNSHSYHQSAAAKAAADSWSVGTPRGEEIVEKLRRGPYRYHEILYQRGVAIHQKQTSEKLGNQAAVASELAIYRGQLNPFSSCMHVAATDHNVCTVTGLVEYSKARPHCAAVAMECFSQQADLAESKH